MVAQVTRGLEWIAADEIADVAGLEFSRIAPGRVEFLVRELSPDIAQLRTVDDVMVEIGRIESTAGASAEELSRFTIDTALDAITAVRSIDAGQMEVVTTRFDRPPHTLQNQIRDALAPDLKDLRVVLNLLSTGAGVIAGIRVTEQPLLATGWRSAAGKLPPQVAAAVAYLAGGQIRPRVADPFCGRGTVAIEAARMLPGSHIFASDLDAMRLMSARENAISAGVTVTFEVADALAPLWRTDSLDAVITHAPWNAQVHLGGAVADAFAPIWSEVRRGLHSEGVLCFIADDYFELAESVPGHLLHQHVLQRIHIGPTTTQIAVFSPSDLDPFPERLRAWHRYAQETAVISRS